MKSSIQSGYFKALKWKIETAKYQELSQSFSNVQKQEHIGFIFDYVGPWGVNCTHDNIQLKNCCPTENYRAKNWVLWISVY